MHDRLTDAELLMAWDIGSARGLIDRALLVLWAAGDREGDLAALPLAERDRRLLRLRATSFGDAMDCLAACPSCGASVEMKASAGALATALPEPTATELRIGPHRIALRPLDSADLAAAAGCVDVGSAERLLFERSVAGTLPDLSTEERRRLDDAMAAQTEAAELALTMECPDCGKAWTEVLDVARFVWEEIEAAALRLMAEVAELARAFHWSEVEVLALGPRRRRAYLTLARST
jgi:hypothetical protein